MSAITTKLEEIDPGRIRQAARKSGMLRWLAPTSKCDATGAELPQDASH